MLHYLTTTARRALLPLKTQALQARYFSKTPKTPRNIFRSMHTEHLKARGFLNRESGILLMLAVNVGVGVCIFSGPEVGPGAVSMRIANGENDHAVLGMVL